MVSVKRISTYLTLLSLMVFKTLVADITTPPDYGAENKSPATPDYPAVVAA
jgi:hypothetical protein